MRVEEMTLAECRAMLARTRVAHLACARDNQPYVVPVHVMFDGNSLYAYSALGQKIEWMRQNPLVCVEIDEVAGRERWESLVALGSYEELLPTPEYESARSVAERLFQTRALWWEPGSVPVAGQPPRDFVVFRLHLTRLTGRRAVPDVAEMETRREEGEENVPHTQQGGWLSHALTRVMKRRRH
jgi:nitroimidazol reductase NimA-like FMN-containing flavoprotein (pyridoxamine 5'-phosphate oxidase superfamily)